MAYHSWDACIVQTVRLSLWMIVAVDSSPGLLQYRCIHTICNNSSPAINHGLVNRCIFLLVSVSHIYVKVLGNKLIQQ